MKSLLKQVSIVVFLFILSGCTQTKTTQYQEPDSVSYKVEEKTEITDQRSVDEAVSVIEKNLAFAQEEDMEGYKTTIVESAHQNTTDELESFFADYDIEHTVLGMAVLEQEENRILLEVNQQSVALNVAEGAEDYRDHVAVANHTLVIENGEWKITDTTMTETFFID